MKKQSSLSLNDFKRQVLKDYSAAYLSREISIAGRKEVLNGRGRFGIFGDGKEIAQIVLAKYLQPGDFRSGYYRDQTLMLALGVVTPKQIFSQLYGNTQEPFSGGRQMVNHYCTPFVNEDGSWKDLTQQFNVSSDISPTASQMPRAVGLALASKLFRQNKDLHQFLHLSNKGNEVCICTIGDGATSEGHFWESLNAIGVIQAPLVVLVWDDGYGISVPKQLQTAKGSISDAFSGLQKEEGTNGIEIIVVKGWDYPTLCVEMEQAIELARTKHTPVLLHIEELTQPLGHSTSGSHERYKTAERLQWERNWDCLSKMREWILESELAEETEIQSVEEGIHADVQDIVAKAWGEYYFPLESYVEQINLIVTKISKTYPHFIEKIEPLQNKFNSTVNYTYKDMIQYLSNLKQLLPQNEPDVFLLDKYLQKFIIEGKENYNTNLFCSPAKSPLRISTKKVSFDEKAKEVNGYEVLNHYFTELFKTNPLVVAFGEDVGQIGDVNQAFSGLQKKFGKHRIMDTGIREITIMGKGIGLALRGLRPIAEIQYLDYLIYGLQPLVDDAVTTTYRTDGKQNCPLIVRTRGHRLEGIFHSGSLLAMLINGLRGMHICVPRNMTQAAGMYNTLLQGNDPGIVIECLNGYRQKEKMPNQILDMTVALGEVEVLQEGSDITIVSYGSVLRIIKEATTQLVNMHNIHCEVIDVQTLLPFDREHNIVKSLQKTNRILFIDEDVPSGTTAYMFQQVIEIQKGYQYLDASPKCLSAKEHRPAYGPDGDYFSKPNIEDVVAAVLEVCKE